MRAVNVRRGLSAALAVALLVGTSSSVSAAGDAGAYECRKVDLANFFSQSYYAKSWLGSDLLSTTVSWSATVSTVNGKTTSRAMTTAQIDSMRQAFDAWDLALANVTFREVASNESPAIEVGWVTRADSSRFTYYFSIEWLSNPNRITKGHIQFSAPSDPAQREFQSEALRAVGSVLGLGFVPASNDYRSVMEPNGSWSDITTFDRQLVRQVHGQEVCTIGERVDSRIATLSAQLEGLQEKVADLESSVSDYESTVEQLASENSRLKAKLSKICKAKPKPKGC